MADHTGIEWTDATWNPTTGCDRVSPGCDNCYAMTLAPRLKAMGSAHYQTDGDPRTSGPGFGVAVHPDSLGMPLRWKKPRRIFVNSMSDLFHKDISDVFIARVFAVMALANRHTFQVLTKRHARMRTLLSSPEFRVLVGQEGYAYNRSAMWEWDKVEWPLRNVWLGVSVENQQWADIRIPALLDTPAAVRFLSCEPLLGPVDVINGLGDGWLTGVDWIIAGGESGHGARPMHPAWVRSLRDQCDVAGVPFLFKQWGEWLPEYANLHRDSAAAAFLSEHGNFRPLVNGIPAEPPRARGGAITIRRVGKTAAGRVLDNRTHDEFPTTQGAPA